MFSTPFGFSLDFSFWQNFLNLPLSEQAWQLFALGGWVLIAYFFIKAGAELWVKYRQETKYVNHWEWIVLAVDIPAMFIQTPKAVEQIFAHLSGAAAHINVRDKFWTGKKQKWFTLEIISIEGYIQFLIRTEKEFLDLVYAALYAQYPEAEITEVEDYVDNIPDHYPDSDYDVMGVDFTLAEDEVYPIRTYPGFEYKISKDEVFSDPMAALLENFTRVGHGENFWMHIIIEPTGSGWKEKGIEKAKELLGGGGHGHGHGGGGLMAWVRPLLALPSTLFKDIAHHGLLLELGEEEAHEEHGEEATITPGIKKTVEAIEEKISKIGFKSKVRALYAARHAVFSPNRCIEGLVGSMNQFHIQSSNAIVPYMSTHAHYDTKHHRKSLRLQNTFVKAFKKRKMQWKKSNGYILNIEELATVWHFPLPFVKTPLLHKAGHKRAEPPSELPVEVTESPLKKKGESVPAEPAEAPPSELPYA